MNTADIAIAVIIAISVLIGLVRGFVVEVLSLAVWAAAVILAMLLGDDVAALFEGSISLPSARYALGYLSVFIGVLLVGAVFVYLMRKIVQGTGLSGTDRMLGMVFGLARGAVIVVILAMMLALTPLSRDPWWRESRALPSFQRLAQLMATWLPEPVAKYFEAGVSALPTETVEPPAGTPAPAEPERKATAEEVR